MLCLGPLSSTVPQTKNWQSELKTTASAPERIVCGLMPHPVERELSWQTSGFEAFPWKRISLFGECFGPPRVALEHFAKMGPPLKTHMVHVGVLSTAKPCLTMLHAAVEVLGCVQPCDQEGQRSAPCSSFPLGHVDGAVHVAAQFVRAWPMSRTVAVCVQAPRLLVPDNHANALVGALFEDGPLIKALKRAQRCSANRPCLL